MATDGGQRAAIAVTRLAFEAQLTREFVQMCDAYQLDVLARQRAEASFRRALDVLRAMEVECFGAACGVVR